MALTKVTSAVLADNSVDSDNYVNGSIDTVHIADLNVTTGKIANDAVTTDKITNDAVTYEKINDEFTTSDVLTAAATVDVDFDAAQVFTLTPNANTTLNITNPVIGVAKTIIVTGAGGTYTVAYTVGGAAGTFNLIAGEYDDTSAKKNFIQITCVSATEFWYSISQIAT